MGNQLNAYDSKENRSISKLSISKLVKSKLKKGCKSGANSNDEFMIKHSQNNKSNDNLVDIECLDPRRKVFVSLIGVYRSWKKLPSLTLYTALLIMPMKKQWIYHPSKYAEELKPSFISQINDFSDVTETKYFMEFLKYKDSQQLIFWILDESVSNTCSDLVSPVWYALSNKLKNLYDPITASNYNPLQLDIKWWQNKQVFISKFDTKPCQIMCELYFVTMKYKTMKEIIYQSNPDTLDPITVYQNDAVITQSVFDVVETHWYISQDYNPYDTNDDDDDDDDDNNDDDNNDDNDNDICSAI